MESDIVSITDSIPDLPDPLASKLSAIISLLLVIHTVIIYMKKILDSGVESSAIYR